MALSVLTLILVEAVKRHALEHYEQNGWDVVVECWADDEIAEVIKRCKTPEGAIKKMRKEISHFAEYRREIENTAF